MTPATRKTKTLVFGATGRIGGALIRRLNQLNMPATALPRHAFDRCISTNAAHDVLRACNLRENDRVIIATGEVDPNADPAKIHRVNTAVPERIANAAISLGAGPVTLGTVMETRIPAHGHNRYIASKADLGAMSQGRWLHLQLHTIYGGPPPHRAMFLGQMLESLVSGTRFSMTSGLQQREYHHLDDEADAILRASDMGGHWPTELASGKKITLADLATDVFRFFGREDLLGINDLEPPKEEVYAPVDIGSPVMFYNYRNARPAVAFWLSAYVRRAC